ncbi:hypothetical protein GQ85_13640 [Rhodococcus rhodochrous]|nr:hypothetical protein GQ85_13640 [Rhodococcus rhodochrous]
MADSPEVRIGTAEREQAQRLLGEHFGAGRLTLTEFEDRSGRIAAAVTRRDLALLFTDLPTVTGRADGHRAGGGFWSRSWSSDCSRSTNSWNRTCGS